MSLHANNSIEANKIQNLSIPSQLAQMILENSTPLTSDILNTILRIKKYALKAHINSTNKTIISLLGSDAHLFTIQSYLKNSQQNQSEINLDSLTINEEKNLIHSEQRDVLIGYHYPILVALAKQFSETLSMPIDDLAQIGIEGIYIKLENFQKQQYHFRNWFTLEIFHIFSKLDLTIYQDNLDAPNQVYTEIDPYEILSRNRENELIKKVLMQLPEKTYDTLDITYGLTDTEQTVEDIANKRDITTQAVYHKIEKAKRFFRGALYKNPQFYSMQNNGEEVVSPEYLETVHEKFQQVYMLIAQIVHNQLTPVTFLEVFKKCDEQAKQHFFAVLGGNNINIESYIKNIFCQDTIMTTIGFFDYFPFLRNDTEALSLFKNHLIKNPSMLYDVIIPRVFSVTSYGSQAKQGDLFILLPMEFWNDPDIHNMFAHWINKQSINTETLDHYSALIEKLPTLRNTIEQKCREYTLEILHSPMKLANEILARLSRIFITYKVLQQDAELISAVGLRTSTYPLTDRYVSIVGLFPALRTDTNTLANIRNFLITRLKDGSAVDHILQSFQFTLPDSDLSEAIGDRIISLLESKTHIKPVEDLILYHPYIQPQTILRIQSQLPESGFSPMIESTIHMIPGFQMNPIIYLWVTRQIVSLLQANRLFSYHWGDLSYLKQDDTLSKIINGYLTNYLFVSNYRDIENLIQFCHKSLQYTIPMDLQEQIKQKGISIPK